MVSPGSSGLVSTNAMVFIINLVRSSEVSALFYVYRADPFITGRLSRSSVCIFYPNRRGKDRCVRLFALLGDMPFSLRRVPLPSFGAVERSSGKSLLRLLIFRGSIYLGARHRTRDKRKAVVAHFIQNTLIGISDYFPFLTQEEWVAIRTQIVGLKSKAECIHESERAAEFDGLFPA